MTLQSLQVGRQQISPTKGEEHAFQLKRWMAINSHLSLISDVVYDNEYKDTKATQVLTLLGVGVGQVV